MQRTDSRGSRSPVVGPSRGATRAVATFALLLVALWSLHAPRRARADDGTLVVGLAVGELAVLGASVGTTIAVADCASRHQHPSAWLGTGHFVLAAANIAIGAFILKLGLDAGEDQSDGPWNLFRALIIGFGIAQLLDGVLMALVGGLAYAQDERTTTPSTSPLTVSFDW